MSVVLKPSWSIRAGIPDICTVVYHWGNTRIETFHRSDLTDVPPAVWRTLTASYSIKVYSFYPLVPYQFPTQLDHDYRNML